MNESIKQDLLTLLFNTVFIVIPWGIFCYIVVKSINPFGNYPITLPRFATKEQVKEFVSKKMNVSPDIVYPSREYSTGDWNVVIYYNRLDCIYSTLTLTDVSILNYLENDKERT